MLCKRVLVGTDSVSIHLMFQAPSLLQICLLCRRDRGFCLILAFDFQRCQVKCPRGNVFDIASNSVLLIIPSFKCPSFFLGKKKGNNLCICDECFFFSVHHYNFKHLYSLARCFQKCHSLNWCKTMYYLFVTFFLSFSFLKFHCCCKTVKNMCKCTTKLSFYILPLAELSATKSSCHV